VKFLLDTNVVSDALKPSPRPALLRRLALHEGQLAICAVSWHELRFGVERLAAGKRREALTEALALWRSLVPIIEYDAAAADWHARQRARLQKAGRTEQPFDGQIASVAVSRELTLVTANTKHFAHYPGLTVANWSR
jgi:tRNA(fMet)-specific endonuclease VapC